MHALLLLKRHGWQSGSLAVPVPLSSSSRVDQGAACVCRLPPCSGGKNETNYMRSQVADEMMVGTEVVSEAWLGTALFDKLNTDEGPSHTVHKKPSEHQTLTSPVWFSFNKHESKCLNSKCCMKNGTAYYLEQRHFCGQ